VVRSYLDSGAALAVYARDDLSG